MLIEIVVAALTVLLLWIACKRPSQLPPGRWGIPLFGYMPLDGKYFDNILADFHKKFGDIYMWRFGTRLQIYIHDYHLVKQIYGSPDFIDRPDMEVMKAFEEVAMGVSGSNGAIWNTNRRFCLRQLRDHGMGKSSLVPAIHEQALVLLEVLKERDGEARPLPDKLQFVIMNVIWKMTANKHFDMDSPKHAYLCDLMLQASKAGDILALADMMPWMRKVLPKYIFRKVMKEDLAINIIGKFSEFFYEMIDEHKANLDPDDPKDMIDAYLIEMNEWKENPEKAGEGIRSEVDLKIVLFDMLFAGTDTTYQNMRWILVYMAAHPDVQRKVQEEIDEVLPKGTLFNLEDKPRIPYTEAAINEVLRKSSFGSIGVPHSAVQDTTLMGYKIPKDALINTATAAIHHDPRYWEKPDQFLPERWLSPEGKFVMKKEGYIPFGSGKRGCPGEGLARMELMVFTITIFQHFTISPPEGKDIDLLHDFGILTFHIPRNQDVVFTSRK